jgi:hypothetical protein
MITLLPKQITQLPGKSRKTLPCLPRHPATEHSPTIAGNAAVSRDGNNGPPQIRPDIASQFDHTAPSFAAYQERRFFVLSRLSRDCAET